MRVDAHARFVNDEHCGPLGVAAGIDMSPAIVASDLVDIVANAIDKRLFVYRHVRGTNRNSVRC